MAAAGTYGNENLAVVHHGMDWGAIWAGVFTFAAIWTVFGALGFAVFASSANPNVAHTVSRMGVGISVWMIILTIIAMYVAGVVTGRLAGVTTRQDGVAHGQTMFGLAVVGILILAATAGAGLTAGSTAGAAPHNANFLGAIADAGWAGFVALFLGWIAAMIGASQGQRHLTATGTTVETDRPVQKIRNVA